MYVLDYNCNLIYIIIIYRNDDNLFSLFFPAFCANILCEEMGKIVI